MCLNFYAGDSELWVSEIRYEGGLSSEEVLIVLNGKRGGAFLRS